MLPLKKVLISCYASVLVVATVASAIEIEESIKNWKAPASFKKRFPYYLSGYDKDGSPVIVMETGRWDYKSAIEAGEEADLDKYMTKMYLHWAQIGNETPDSPGSVIIADMDGFGARQASQPGVIAFLVRLFPKFEVINRRPGLKHVYVVNVNFLAQRIFDVGRPLLGDLNSKLDVYGTNPDKWKPELLKEIDSDQLPEWYGGSAHHKALKVYPS